MPRASKAELSRQPIPQPRSLPRLGLWALMQSHRYGQSICAEVLAPNKATAAKIFDDVLDYTSCTHGSFFIARFQHHLHPEVYAYTAKMKPRAVRFLRGVVWDDSPSPFPPGPGKDLPPVYANKPTLQTSHSRNLATYRPRSGHRATPEDFRRAGGIPANTSVTPKPTGRVPAGTTRRKTS